MALATPSYAEVIATPEAVEAADKAGVDPLDLQGAVNTTGLPPMEYLYQAGELARPVPPKPPAPLAPAIGWPWTDIKGCETPGLGWNANTGNGFEGGIQFLNSTWLNFGGGQFAPHAYQATAAEQVIVAERVHRAKGNYSDWPACRIKLHLP